jgi:prepilin signal peptidase PulO-like enzyme (type II secretory pathway)
LAISRSPLSLIFQSAPLLIAAAFVAIALLWPRIGATTLWILAGVCALSFAIGLWHKFGRQQTPRDH